jgi:succinate-acetate transporter protein
MADDVKLANPAVLGLTCFGMTTVLLNLHNAGLFKMDVPILAMGLFLGGAVQIIAGVLEFKKGNSFGLAAFSAYGAFWLTLVFILIAKPLMVNATAIVVKDGLVVDGARKFVYDLQAGNTGFAWYLLLWGIFTCFMFIGTFKVNRVLQFVFATLIVLFGLLAVHFAWFTGAGDSTAVLKLAGVVGIICGGSAIYLAMAELVNEMYGKTILPILPMGEKEAYKRPEDL